MRENDNDKRRQLEAIEREQPDYEASLPDREYVLGRLPQAVCHRDGLTNGLWVVCTRLMLGLPCGERLASGITPAVAWAKARAALEWRGPPAARPRE